MKFLTSDYFEAQANCILQKIYLSFDSDILQKIYLSFDSDKKVREVLTYGLFEAYLQGTKDGFEKAIEEGKTKESTLPPLLYKGDIMVIRPGVFAPFKVNTVFCNYYSPSLSADGSPLASTLISGYDDSFCFREKLCRVDEVEVAEREGQILWEKKHV